MNLVNAALSAVLNLLLLVAIPFLCYAVTGRRRHGRTFRESAARAGLQIGVGRYLAISALFAAITIIALLLFPPSTELFLRPGSPYLAFRGLGLGGEALLLSLLYGVAKTGFSEEFFFRGLIAGSLARRYGELRGNLIQATIFLAPHLLVLLAVPELITLMPLVFAGALIKGWVRIRSGSILGPTLIHAAANVTTCLSLAARNGT